MKEVDPTEGKVVKSRCRIGMGYLIGQGGMGQYSGSAYICI